MMCTQSSYQHYNLLIIWILHQICEYTEFASENVEIVSEIVNIWSLYQKL